MPQSYNSNPATMEIVKNIPDLQRISDYVYYYAQHQPEHEALIWQHVRITYSEFAEKVKAVSMALLSYEIEKGDRVAFLGTPRPEYFIVMMAAVDIGAIWIGLNPRYRIGEFRHVVNQGSPKLIFAQDQIDGRDYSEELSILFAEFDSVDQVIIFDTEIPSVGVKFEDFLDCTPNISESRWRSAREHVEADDTAVIIFTSGTTGKPKGAMNSHYGLVYCAQIEFSRWPSRSMRVLQNMPINHIANIGMMSSYALVAGGTLVFMDRFDPGELLHTIEQEKITFWLQAPAMFHLAVNHPDFGQTDLSSLEYIIWGGGPMPQHLVEFLHGLGATLAMAYGMTELTAYVTYSDLDAGPEPLAGTIGRPEPRYELRLIKKDGNLANVGESGEIQAKGRWLMNGYFNQPEASSDAFTENGWLKTGDVAELRADGNWKLVGRIKEMFKSGGYNIYPREIEIVIEEHPNVAMSAVIGVPDPIYHEVGYAFVQCEQKTEITPVEIAGWCKERLANYKVPKVFEVVEELPKLPIGKIDKQALKKRVDPLTG